MADAKRKIINNKRKASRPAEDSPKRPWRVPDTVANVHRTGKRCATGNSPGVTVPACAGRALEES